MHDPYKSFRSCKSQRTLPPGDAWPLRLAHAFTRWQLNRLSHTSRSSHVSRQGNACPADLPRRLNRVRDYQSLSRERIPHRFAYIRGKPPIPPNPQTKLRYSLFGFREVIACQDEGGFEVEVGAIGAHGLAAPMTMSLESSGGLAGSGWRTAETTGAGCGSWPQS